MPETPDTANDIKQIKFRLESIEGTQELLLMEKREAVRAQLVEIFDQTPNLREVYAAIDGNKTQVEIVQHLKKSGVQVSQPTVSRRMDLLLEHGIVERADSPKGIVLKKKDVLERVIRLSRALNGRS